ncbi:hypothetical protein N7536_011300 [Penicillium majusculum]|uniref:Uncharacterized protein n=1 Tax=Penicillium solitum TaxID=60172 RepID=A0A1V6QZ12_9EURO|nr:uncharacterized protein PENSOL_c027G07423 [Penicillium solitum]KAJ5680161.1 hypothetical protein N7536_011300 [Penicillium majusculum]OQD94252.1 hypothetical protein PENSOL_c027G07423 [Penicillium solitum]
MANRLPEPTSADQGIPVLIPPIHIGSRIEPPGLWAQRILELPYRRSRRGSRLRTPTLRYLIQLPPHREPSWRSHRHWTNSTEDGMVSDRTENIEAALMQVVRTVMEVQCVPCQEGCGPFTHCVTVVGAEEVTCCANCHFRSQDTRCRWPSPTPPPISQPASSNRRSPLSPDANRQAQDGTRSTRQAGTRSTYQAGTQSTHQAGTPAPPQVLQDLIPIQQNITQATRLREEVERARQRVQQSHQSVETYLQTAIDTMNLLQAYITQVQGTDRTRSTAVLTTLSGYINLTMQNLTSAHRHQSALSQPLGALNVTQTRLDQAQIEAINDLLALLSDIVTRPDAPV